MLPHALVHAGTDVETRATCLDARRASDTRMLLLRCSMFIARTVTHVNCKGLQIHARHSYSRIFTSVNELNIISIYVTCCVVFQLCPAESCGFLADPEKIVMHNTRYKLAT